MSTDLAGRTPWEARQYQKDHGQRAAMALALRLAAEHIRSDEDGPLPPPFTIMDPVSGGSDEERKAVVDAWAKANHVTAGWDGEHHHWNAKLSFGPVTLMVYTIPSQREAPAAQREPELAVA